MPFGNVILYNGLDDILVKVFGTVGGLALAPQNMGGVHSVADPVSPVVRVVEKERLQVVHGVGEAGLRGLVGFELLEERVQFVFL